MVARFTSALVLVVALSIALLAQPSTATFAGKNGRITFHRDTSGNRVEIFSANRDGSDVRKLTSSGSKSASVIADWSPNGQAIAFDSDRTDVDGRTAPVQVYLMSADGSAVTQLTRGPGFHGTPSWSPAGTHLIIDSDWGERSLNGLWLIPASDPDGVTVEDAQRVTVAPKGIEFDSEPQISPDGTTVVFIRHKSPERTALYSVNVDGTGLERLSPYGLNASDPDWSPDGKWITFDSGDAGAPGSKGDIYVSRPDGSGKRALTDTPPVTEDDFQLSNNPVFYQTAAGSCSPSSSRAAASLSS